MSDFRPALRFVAWFLVIYVGGNLIYGLYIEAYRPAPDSMTILVTKQSAAIVNSVSPPVSVKPLQSRPIVYMNNNDRIVLEVFEGCNGLNVMVIFLAFVIAYGGTTRRLIGFSAAGLIVIHLANLARIILLYITAMRWPQYFYYFHKYFFTACLYAVVFVLWLVWIRWSGKTRKDASA